jgi:hypothetical protein
LFPAARSASNKARVLSRLERMPKSKSASHSPETAEAKWKTPSNFACAKPEERCSPKPSSLLKGGSQETVGVALTAHLAVRLCSAREG